MPRFRRLRSASCGLFALALYASAQIAVTPQRIAGLLPHDWPIGDGGPAVNAFLLPSALAWDRNGSLLIADYANGRIRRLAADGSISTVFDGALYGLGTVYGMAVDSRGNLYLSDSYVGYPARLVEISPDGRMTVLANPGFRYAAPGIALDAADNLYISDPDSGYVWKRSPAGDVQTIAGNGLRGPAGQGGPALQVALAVPYALAFDRAGRLLIGDSDGVLRLNSDGNLTRLFGSGHPARIVPSADGGIYTINGWDGIRRWDPSGANVLIAGNDQSGFSDGCAQPGGARIAKYASVSPADMVIDGAGRLFVADNSMDRSSPWLAGSAGRIRRIDPDGSIRSVAGTGSQPRESQPGGPALNAVLRDPQALAVDRAGNVFFVEPSAHRVHEITAAGQFLTVAGSDSPPPGEDPACYPPSGPDVLSNPKGVAVDADANLYIADTGNRRILRRTAQGALTVIADKLAGPTSIAVDPQGNIYFLDDRVLRRIRPDGILESPPTPEPVIGLGMGVDGRLFLIGSRLYKETVSGIFRPLLTGSLLGISAADPAGAIYTVGLFGLQRVSPNCNIAPVAVGSELAQFGLLRGLGLASDSLGNVYFPGYDSIWKIPAIPSAAVDKPSPQFDGPGVFNAASNLTAVKYVSSSPNPFHPPTPYPVNDAITGNEILRIKGSCLGPLEPTAASLAGGRLPTTLAGTRVLFDGVPAPLVSVQSTELLAIVPQTVASQGKTEIVVENQGVQASASLDAAPAVPGIFLTGGTQAAAINEDSTLNGPDHPAPAGSVVALFFTGAGATDPPLEDGVPPGFPLAQLALPIVVQVGESAAEILYAGVAPGLAGVSQVNIRIPPVAAPGPLPIKLSVGGISRNQSAWLVVAPNQ